MGIANYQFTGVSSINGHCRPFATIVSLRWSCVIEAASAGVLELCGAYTRTKGEGNMIACQTELECLSCGSVTTQTVVYASLYLKRVVCNQCLHTIEKPATELVWQYSRDLPWRAFALTRRLKSEALSHPVLFASSLPKRIFYKPIELSQELVEVCL